MEKTYTGFEAIERLKTNAISDGWALYRYNKETNKVEWSMKDRIAWQHITTDITYFFKTEFSDYEDSSRKNDMFKDIYVLFPPRGEEKIEFQFFLEKEGERFYEFYKEVYRKYPKFYSKFDTFEEYLKDFLLPHLQEFTEIRLGHDTWTGESIWIGVDNENVERGVVLPKLDFKFYKGAVAYRYWQQNRTK